MKWLYFRKIINSWQFIWCLFWINSELKMVWRKESIRINQQQNKHSNWNCHWIKLKHSNPANSISFHFRFRFILAPKRNETGNETNECGMEWLYNCKIEYISGWRFPANPNCNFNSAINKPNQISLISVWLMQFEISLIAEISQKSTYGQLPSGV